MFTALPFHYSVCYTMNHVYCTICLLQWFLHDETCLQNACAVNRVRGTGLLEALDGELDADGHRGRQRGGDCDRHLRCEYDLKDALLRFLPHDESCLLHYLFTTVVTTR